jgi:DNA-binding XRE family transcriptional regulator
MTAGRPTAYDPAYCEQVIELGKAGKSKAQMASQFDVSRQTIDNWAEAHPEFLEALTRAMAHCQAWWENQGQSGLTTPGFNAAVWKKSVEARFREDYTERQEQTVHGDITHRVIERRIVDPKDSE